MLRAAMLAAAMMMTMGCGSDGGTTRKSDATTTGTEVDTGSEDTDTTGDEDTGAETTGDDTDTTGDDTDTTGDDTDTTGTDDTGTTGDAVSFDTLYETVFKPSGCTSGYCHGGGSGGMQLQSAEQSYAEMVGVEATTAECEVTQRVVPGEPEQSMLWLRVQPLAEGGTADCGNKMPQGSEGLSSEDAKLVYDWIKAGAKQQ